MFILENSLDGVVIKTVLPKQKGDLKKIRNSRHQYSNLYGFEFALKKLNYDNFTDTLSTDKYEYFVTYTTGDVFPKSIDILINDVLIHTLYENDSINAKLIDSKVHIYKEDVSLIVRVETIDINDQIVNIETADTIIPVANDIKHINVYHADSKILTADITIAGSYKINRAENSFSFKTKDPNVSYVLNYDNIPKSIINPDKQHVNIARYTPYATVEESKETYDFLLGLKLLLKRQNPAVFESHFKRIGLSLNPLSDCSNGNLITNYKQSSLGHPEFIVDFKPMEDAHRNAYDNNDNTVVFMICWNDTFFAHRIAHHSAQRVDNYRHLWANADLDQPGIYHYQEFVHVTRNIKERNLDALYLPNYINSPTEEHLVYLSNIVTIEHVVDCPGTVSEPVPEAVPKYITYTLITTNESIIIKLKVNKDISKPEDEISTTSSASGIVNHVYSYGTPHSRTYLNNNNIISNYDIMGEVNRSAIEINFIRNQELFKIDVEWQDADMLSSAHTVNSSGDYSVGPFTGPLITVSNAETLGAQTPIIYDGTWGGVQIKLNTFIHYVYNGIDAIVTPGWGGFCGTVANGKLELWYGVYSDVGGGTNRNSFIITTDKAIFSGTSTDRTVTIPTTAVFDTTGADMRDWTVVVDDSAFGTAVNPNMNVTKHSNTGTSITYGTDKHCSYAYVGEVSSSLVTRVADDTMLTGFQGQIDQLNLAGNVDVGSQETYSVSFCTGDLSDDTIQRGVTKSFMEVMPTWAPFLSTVEVQHFIYYDLTEDGFIPDFSGTQRDW